MSVKRGSFIVLEGADGCGKSTQARSLVRRMKVRGRHVLHVRDPGSTGLSEAVRRILLDPATGTLCAEAEACLYMAARAQLVSEVIEPALAAGTTVVSERWTLSTEVYQGLAGGLGAARVRRMAGLVAGRVTPDLTIVLDVAIGAGLGRLGRERDRMEQKGAKFHAQVVRGYRRLARGRAAHVLVAAGTLEEVARCIDAEVRAHVR